MVLTGAGISTESGIPDFRGPQGVWTKDPSAEKLATLQHYVSDPEVRKRAWQKRLHSEAFAAEPNTGHRALIELERRGKLHTLITQNIDGLHQKAGSARAVGVEIHGTIHEVVCLDCGERAPMQRALDRVRAGEVDPPAGAAAACSSRRRSRSGSRWSRKTSCAASAPPRVRSAARRRQHAVGVSSRRASCRWRSDAARRS